MVVRFSMPKDDFAPVMNLVYIEFLRRDPGGILIPILTPTSLQVIDYMTGQVNVPLNITFRWPHNSVATYMAAQGSVLLYKEREDVDDSAGELFVVPVLVNFQDLLTRYSE